MVLLEELLHIDGGDLELGVLGSGNGEERGGECHAEKTSE